MECVYPWWTVCDLLWRMCDGLRRLHEVLLGCRSEGCVCVCGSRWVGGRDARVCHSLDTWGGAVAG
jgi:hypothetical protein